MPVYSVRVEVVWTGDRRFTVQASSEADAENKAMDKAMELDIGEFNNLDCTDGHAMSITLIKSAHS
jgi:hypothetical protein